MTYDKEISAIIVCIGKELLRGKTLEKNSYFLSKKLTALGCKVTRVSIVDDEEKEIGEEIRDSLRRKPNYIFTTGGLGPTFDDMTIASIAKVLRRKMRVDREALKQVQAYYREMKRRRVVDTEKINPMRCKMAILPVGSSPLKNSCGGAPGVKILEGKTTIYCMPGVPPEMKAIFIECIRPEITPHRRKEARIDIPVAIRDESILSPWINRLMKKFPGIYVKSRVHGTEEKIRIVISVHGEKREDVLEAAKSLKKFSRATA